VLLDTPEANATVLTGIVDGNPTDATPGKRTLAVTFRGTDQLADFTDFVWFGEHYEKYRPLLKSLKTYLGDSKNGIEQVL
jgi:hypothetical protein